MIAINSVSILLSTYGVFVVFVPLPFIFRPTPGLSDNLFVVCSSYETHTSHDNY